MTDDNQSLNDIVGVKGGTKIYNQIIYQSFEENEDRGLNDYMDKKDEIVDVVTGYNWSIDSMVTNADSNDTNPETANKIAHVPHCYAIEYQQRYSSSMTNLINSLVGINVGASNLVDTAKAITTKLGDFLGNLTGADVTGTVQSVKDSAISAIGNLTGVQPQGQVQPQAQGNGNEQPKYIGDIMKYIKDTFNDSVKTISNPLRAVADEEQNHYLQPYSLLYDMTSTGLKYCFPMISNPPVIKASNSYADSQDETSILSANSLFSKISSFASSIASFNRDLSQFNSLLLGDKNNGSIYERTNVEKAKFFQYPTQTDSYTITFPLFNTVKSSNPNKPIWTKNYKFILLFCMRNMIFRKDNTSFFPPLFYDLTIPGVIRQPFTYVESVNVQPQGMVRMLSCSELFSFMGKKKMSVPVPEAWIVTITFKSLIPTSANLVLSALDDSIVTAISQ